MYSHKPAQMPVAIIGMALRFPCADSPQTFWDNLNNGSEAVRFFSERELRDAGIGDAELHDQAYIRARAPLHDFEYFDAPFFGYSPQEARLIDPQQRVFLECAFEALCSVKRTDDDEIGLFAGSGVNTYLLRNLLPNRTSVLAGVDEFQALIASDKDFLTTRVAYKLNLRGPVHTIQTACSSSLVAVHAACQSLANGECDMALAGGVSIRVPQITGYFYKEGLINSRDGHCRAYDDGASGTVGGSGAAVVLLKRLADAQADGDEIIAVIKGSATNNDGASKAGFSAPSIQGQARVIRRAMDRAQIHPEEISYVEGHGTATVLGDPIEISALTEVYRERTGQREYCALGSVKTNIGHLDAAAGIAGLIKAALCLRMERLVPSLHFRRPNPRMDLANSPFFVNTESGGWIPRCGRRLAAVSSFGIGGSNAHVILEGADPSGLAGASAYLPPRPVLPFKRERHWIDAPNAAKPDSKGFDGQMQTFPTATVATSPEEREITWHEVADIWTRHLGVETIGPDDNYFSLGGDSLAGIHVIEEVNKTFQCKLSPGLLIEAPVLRDFTRRLLAMCGEKKARHSNEVVVRLNASTSSLPPLFVVHAAGGHVYSYRSLIDAMTHDRPVIGLQSPFILCASEDLQHMEAIADHLISHIRRIQPAGPYHLLGASFGGALSFEMACLLAAGGEEIAFLGMIDTPGGEGVPQAPFTNAAFLAYHLNLNLGGDRLSHEYALAGLSEHEQIAAWRSRLAQAGRTMPDVGDDKHLKILEMFRTNMEILRKYRPRQAELPIHFFEARDRGDLNAHHPHRFWRGVSASLDLTMVDGNHITMNEPPNVATIAAVLDKELGSTFVEFEI